MEEVKCLFCSKEHQLFWQENDYIGRKCFQCSLIYLSPRPSEKDMAVLYNTGSAGGESAREHIIYSFGKNLMAKHALSIIRKLRTKGDILEIGSGGGQFLLNAQKEGFNPFAIEINQELVFYISKQLGIKVENSSASNPYYFNSQKFDIIYHKDVLSHLHDPIGTFKILNNKLKQDGILIFETGNFGGVRRSWLNFIGRLGYPEHLYLFSVESVKQLLKISGFELVSYYCYSIVSHQLISKILRTTKYGFDHTNINNKKISPFQKVKDYITYFLVYRLGRVLPKSWPATVIYIARKK